MEIEVLSIVGDNNGYFAYGWNFNSYGKYHINGSEITQTIKNNGVYFTDNDVLTFTPNQQTLSHYQRNDQTMSIQEFKAKPQTYDCDSSEEYTLRAIANKKELAGFNPVYEAIKPELLTYKIIGVIGETDNRFITCSISTDYLWREDKGGIFVVNAKNIAMDEYLKLSEAYKDHAKFEIPTGEISYLEFLKINYKYAFEGCYPFNNRLKDKVFTKIDLAINEEILIRETVKKYINRAVFKKELTDEKKIQIIDRLSIIKKLKTKKECDKLLDIIIEDLTDYKSKILI